MPFDVELSPHQIELFRIVYYAKIKFVILTLVVSFSLASSPASAFPGIKKPPQVVEQIIPVNCSYLSRSGKDSRRS